MGFSICRIYSDCPDGVFCDRFFYRYFSLSLFLFSFLSFPREFYLFVCLFFVGVFFLNKSLILETPWSLLAVSLWITLLCVRTSYIHIHTSQWPRVKKLKIFMTHQISKTNKRKNTPTKQKVMEKKEEREATPVKKTCQDNDHCINWKAAQTMKYSANIARR